MKNSCSLKKLIYIIKKYYLSLQKKYANIKMIKHKYIIFDKLINFIRKNDFTLKNT